MDRLECEVGSFNYVSIESVITQFYGLGYAESSDFMEIKEGINTITIIGTRGSGTFSVLAYKTKDGKKMISCTAVGKLTRKK